MRGVLWALGILFVAHVGDAADNAGTNSCPEGTKPGRYQKHDSGAVCCSARCMKCGRHACKSKSSLGHPTPFAPHGQCCSHSLYQAGAFCYDNEGRSTPSKSCVMKMPEKDSLRIAVMVSGSFRRYFLRSSVKHLVQPMVRQGHSVDYYLYLVTGEHKTWRTYPYLSHLTWDPVFGTPAENGGKMPSAEIIRTVIHSSMLAAGVGLCWLELRVQVDLDDDPRLQKIRQRALRLKKSDPDAMFPVVSNGAGRIAAANRNMLRLFRALEQLWMKLVSVEMDRQVKYDSVLVTRDDVDWMQDVDMSWLHETQFDAELTVLACKDRSLYHHGSPPMLNTEINDYAQLFVRHRAELIGRYFSNLFSAGVENCTVNLTRASWNPMQATHRRCTSEELLRWILTKNQVTWRKVSQARLPFQRSAHVITDDGTNSSGVVTCFHKYCQSKFERLPPDGRTLCVDPSVSELLAPPEEECDQREYLDPVTFEMLLLTNSTSSAPARVAVFTINLGEYDAPVAYDCQDAFARTSVEFRSRFNVSCLHFSDSTTVLEAARGWTPVKLDQPTNPRRTQRSLKILGELFHPSLDGFDYVLYHDSKVGPKYGKHRSRSTGLHLNDVCIIQKHVTTALQLLATSPTFDLVTYEHPIRRTAEAELEAVRKEGLCEASVTRSIQNLHDESAFLDDAGLPDTNVLVRRSFTRTTSQTLKQGMRMWLDNMVSTGCMRDQVHFGYAMWKANVSYTLLSDGGRPLVKIQGHTAVGNKRRKAWNVEA